jgi:hypothetical protein
LSENTFRTPSVNLDRVRRFDKTDMMAAPASKTNADGSGTTAGATPNPDNPPAAEGVPEIVSNRMLGSVQPTTSPVVIPARKAMF